VNHPKALVAMSMKGGVGKTTTAIGLANALKRRGYKVGILDVDVHGSAMPRALQLHKDPGYDPLLGGQLRPARVDGLQMFSIGLLFAEDTPNMWDGPMKLAAVEQVTTHSIAWDADLEWLVVDSPPTSGDEVQSLLGNMPNIFGAVIVTQPNDLSLLGDVKTLNLLRETQTPVCGLLANMSGYTCPHCGKESNPFDRETVDIEALADEFGVPYLGEVPFAPESERAPVLDKVVDTILGGQRIVLPQEKRGLRRRLMGLALG
jgi:ATP-binding protein involved in chromosome partitioning